MRTVFFLTSSIIIISCGGSGSERSKQLSASDSLVINFNVPQTNNIEKTVTTTEKKAIKKLAGYVDGKSTENYKCGYDGTLMFYKQGVLVNDVSFNYSGEGCRHFIMKVDDHLAATTMSNEAADFLKSLAEGKGWY